MPRHVHDVSFFEPRIIHALLRFCSLTMGGVRCAAFLEISNMKRLN